MRKVIGVGSALALALALWSHADDMQHARSGDGKKDDKAMPDLVAALKASPGCLGVETAKTSSGKQVIFAWFEDKKACLKWYYSDVHKLYMHRFFPDYKSTRKPMADVPDDCGPIMAIASITLEGPPTKENPLPFKQIAIEMYTPLGGGLSIGGTFAPAKMKAPLPRDGKKDAGK